MEARVKALEEKLKKMGKDIRAENESYWKMAGYQAQMVIMFGNLTTLPFSKGILNETDLDDIKNIKEEFDELRKDVYQSELLGQADEGKPQ